MFRTDAFGRHIRCLPRLSFNGGGGDGGGDDTQTPQEQGFDFPADTPWKEMEPAQQAEYWRYQSRKHERRADSRKDYDDLKSKAEQWDKHEHDSKDEQQKAVDEAREEGRRDGENIGAEKHLKTAVKATFRAATGMTQEDVDKAFEHVDAASFTDDHGDIDVTKVEEFAETLGTSGNASNQSAKDDPTKRALNRSGSGTGGGQPTMQERRQATREALTKNKPNT